MTALLILGFLGLMLLGIPVAIVMLIVGLTYLYLNSIPMVLVVQFMLEGSMVFVLIAIPMYLLAASIMNAADVSKRLIRLCNALVGHWRGGLAQVNVLSSVAFSGMSGEAVADSAALGSVLIPAMEKEGYDPPFAAAVSAATAVIGPVMPPSVPMIICASLAGVSVGRMFMGGIIPGLLLALFFMVVCYWLSHKRHYPKKDHRAPLSEVMAAFADSILPLFTAVIILGGIFSGVFTPIEAAGVAAAYSFVIAFFIYRNVNLKILLRLARDGAQTVGVIMFILSMAKFYNFVLTREQIPQKVLATLVGLSSDPTVILIIVVLALFVIGLFLSATAGILLTVPILMPLVDLGMYNNVHFFVVATLALILATNTPPVGINLFVILSISKKVSMARLVRELLPFYGCLILIIFICIFFPSVVTVPGDWIFGKL